MSVLKSKLFIKYVKRLLILTAMLCIAAIVFRISAPVGWTNPLALPLIGMFFIIMLLSHLISIRVIGNNLQKFVRTYMLSAVIRLILYMIIILIYIVNRPDNTLNFVLTFFVLYIAYTAFEVKQISRSILPENSLKKDREEI